MRLLVSVRDASEAEAALAGGADIIDAKEPLNGPLGPVAPDTLAAITAAVAGKTPISVALGDVGTADLRECAQRLRSPGVSFMKIGFAGTHRYCRLADDVRTLAASIGPANLVLVAYADYERADAPSPESVVSLAEDAGAWGVLLDTHDKRSAALTALMSPRELHAFVMLAKARGRVVALAGRLTAQDVEPVRVTGADILGVRGAACNGGRAGVVAVDRVLGLRSHIDRTVSIVC